MTKQIVNTKLIIWDETPMINKMCFEFVDRLIFRDVLWSLNSNSDEQTFGGKVVVFGSDFIQTFRTVRSIIFFQMDSRGRRRSYRC